MANLDPTALSVRGTLEFGKRIFLALCLLAFVVSGTTTLLWCTAMASMGVMEMPGGWTMSMMWMPMPDQGWLALVTSFLGMWTVMMVAMMLPSLAPALWRCFLALGRSDQGRAGWLALLVSLGYFIIWALTGLLVYPLALFLAQAAMGNDVLAGAVPILAAGVVIVVGALQFTGWKTRRLACCREVLAHGHHPLPRSPASALRFGFRLGLECLACCGSLMFGLLAVGAMDPVSMVAVTVAITLERFAPNGALIARLVGIATLGLGFYQMLQAFGT